MKKIIICSLLFLFSHNIFAQDVLNNQSIIDLVELGFESEVLVSKINSSEVKFDTSMSELKRLKSKNVPSSILALMIEKSKVVVEAGIFYLQNEKLKRIEPSIFSGTKTKTLGAMLTSGIAPAKVKSYIHNLSSNNKIKVGTQIFIFHFDTKKNKLESSSLGANNWWFKTATSPNEFVLTELKQKKKKNQRELVTGKVSAFGGSQVGIETKKTIPFTIEKDGKGKYKVIPKTLLEPGEYCFFYQGTIPVGGYNNQSIFDFSIR